MRKSKTVLHININKQININIKQYFERLENIYFENEKIYNKLQNKPSNINIKCYKEQLQSQVD